QSKLVRLVLLLRLRPLLLRRLRPGLRRGPNIPRRLPILHRARRSSLPQILNLLWLERTTRMLLDRLLPRLHTRIRWRRRTPRPQERRHHRLRLRLSRLRGARGLLPRPLVGPSLLVLLARLALRLRLGLRDHRLPPHRNRMYDRPDSLIGDHRRRRRNRWPAP